MARLRLKFDQLRMANHHDKILLITFNLIPGNMTMASYLINKNAKN
jgi:hypothetical protein